MPRNAKGSRCERALLEYLADKGYLVHRVAGSGKNDEAICDLVAIDKSGKVFLIEVKARKSVYYPKENFGQIKELIRYAKNYNAVPLLAVKLNYKDWKLFDLTQGVPEKVE